MAKQVKGAAAEFYTVKVGDTDVIFDGPAFDRGELVQPSWAFDEQCENCGEPIGEVGEACVGNVVKCACGARYRAAPGMMIDGYVTDL